MTGERGDSDRKFGGKSAEQRTSQRGVTVQFLIGCSAGDGLHQHYRHCRVKTGGTLPYLPIQRKKAAVG